ncbi:MAG: hypothetical protein GFH27_549287n121 [Chloroflexi bacterium AL-W]|nr:hypothetical protein [Chloroflexi bacterium AL-N1]NOK66395.1 hypothetical protein [Chloroflexi bacterium AL-N10]NOK71783.1 hypothetical protein [Chloroflexi bacterium AL-N5]NOK81040.1 hypothetical protein [Chloroflexi bacterium AL-W]NOK89313.1 hypothetical protein [Chloroflexi bacterium AL-N15]
MTPHACIMVVDDQQDHLQAVQLILEGVGYDVILQTSAAEALNVLQTSEVDLILADIAMPHMNGYQLLDEVRRHAKWSTIAFVFLTARALDSDIRYGKSLGVDDYLTKPIQPEDLLATIEGKLRRRQHLEQSLKVEYASSSGDLPLVVGQLSIDPDRHQARLSAQPLALSVREFALLEYLARNVGHVVESRQLLQITHGFESADATEARELIRPLIRSLRHKLGCNEMEAGYIETIRGLGYRMVEPSER